MKLRTTATFFLVALLSGCASHDGNYAPGCVAYAGNQVELSGGTFVWDRFTDQIRVDSDGQIIDPFPDFPVSGNYTLDGRRMTMIAESGQSMQPMYLHQDGSDYRLLTADEDASWQSSGAFDNCVLTRQYEKE